jgi:hypothetical protein
MDISDIVAQIRNETKEEDEPVAKPLPFDPLKKIASILQRTKVANLKAYYSNSSRVNSLFNDHFRNGFQRQLYDHPDFSLAECLGAGLLRLGDRSSYMIELLGNTKAPDDFVDKIVLIRILHNYFVKGREPKALTVEPPPSNTRQKPKLEIRKHQKTLFRILAAYSSKDIARRVAESFYQRSMVNLYHTHYGIPPSGQLRLDFSRRAKVLEEYQDPAKEFIPMNPKAMMAAVAYYEKYPNIDLRLQRTKSVFDLIMLAGVKIFQKECPPSDAQRIQGILDDSKDLEYAISQASVSYLLSSIGGLRE